MKNIAFICASVTKYKATKNNGCVPLKSPVRKTPQKFTELKCFFQNVQLGKSIN